VRPVFEGCAVVLLHTKLSICTKRCFLLPAAVGRLYLLGCEATPYSHWVHRMHAYISYTVGNLRPPSKILLSCRFASCPQYDTPAGTNTDLGLVPSDCAINSMLCNALSWGPAARDAEAATFRKQQTARSGGAKLISCGFQSSTGAGSSRRPAACNLCSSGTSGRSLEASGAAGADKASSCPAAASITVHVGRQVLKWHACAVKATG
jgi:hypothetical protein